LTIGASNIAIVAGVNLILSPLNGLSRAGLSALSNQGMCRAFDDTADGFVQG
jgi:acyl transferase domain-containing protein